MKIVSITKAKAQLSSLMAEVAYGGSWVVIERRGKPLAALISMRDLEFLDKDKAASPPRGELGLVGLLSALEDEELDAMVDHIDAERARDTGRPVDLRD
jgi:prevent-host-death family protein